MSILTVSVSENAQGGWRVKASGQVVDATGKRKTNKFGHDMFAVDVYTYPVAGDPNGDCGRSMTSAATQLLHKLYSGTTATLGPAAGDLVHDYIHRGFGSTNGQRSFDLPFDDLVKAITERLLITVIPTADGFHISDKTGTKQAKCRTEDKSVGLADYLVKQTRVDLDKLGVTQQQAIKIIATEIDTLDLSQPQQFSARWVESAVSSPDSRTKSAPITTITTDLAEELATKTSPLPNVTDINSQSIPVYGSKTMPGPPKYDPTQTNTHTPHQRAA